MCLDIYSVSNSAVSFLVTDRKWAITKAVQNNIPNIKLSYCWNHMRMDLKRWLEKYNATSDDKTVYRSDFMSLLESESLEDFLEKESELKSKWTEAMTD